MSSTSFVSAPFTLVSVQAIAGNGRIRVTFSRAPLAVSFSGVHDALNIANYTLTGPSSVVIGSSATVGLDDHSVDLIIPGVLPAGTWTLSASTAIQTSGGSALSSPTSLNFTVISNAIAPASPGATNDTAATILQKHIGPTFNDKSWKALIAALATGDDYNTQLAQAAYEQLFISTASGVYLDRRAAGRGIKRISGLSDDVFRRLAIKTSAHKLTEEAFLEVLSAFYGDESVSASITSVGVEPFTLAAGDTLNLLINEKTNVPVTFTASDFAISGAAKATEVVSGINRTFNQMGAKAYAIATAGAVKLVSRTKGLSSSVRVNGGTAQKQLLFPTLLGSADPAKTWDVTIPSTGVVRFTCSGTTTLNLLPITTDNYVLISGAAFNSANKGSFPITNVWVGYVAGVLTQYFEIANIGVAQAGVAIAAASDIYFFSGEKITINSSSRPVVVAARGPRTTDISMPATTQAVARTEGTGAYLQTPTTFNVSSITRDGSGTVTITTSTPHSLTVGGTSGLVQLFGVTASGVSNPITVTLVPNSTTIVATTPDFPVAFTSSAAGMSVCVFAAKPRAYKGPYTFSNQSSIQVSNISSTTTSSLAKGHSYGSVGLVNGSAFPDEVGFICFGFGQNYQVGPIKYLGKLDANTLILDYSYQFASTIPSGAEAMWLPSNEAFSPSGPGIGSLYATGSATGRVGAETTIKSIKASGASVNINIIYPGDRGLGGEGFASAGGKLSDKVAVWAGDNVDAEFLAAMETTDEL